jgi:hypothetical protein
MEFWVHVCEIKNANFYSLNDPLFDVNSLCMNVCLFLQVGDHYVWPEFEKELYSVRISEI